MLDRRKRKEEEEEREVPAEVVLRSCGFRNRPLDRESPHPATSKYERAILAYITSRTTHTRPRNTCVGLPSDIRTLTWSEASARTGRK